MAVTNQNYIHEDVKRRLNLVNACLPIAHLKAIQNHIWFEKLLPLARPRHRWEDNIKMNLNKLV
jgi:hypothetical protein